VIIKILSRDSHAHDHHHDITESLQKVEVADDDDDASQEEVGVLAICPCCRPDPVGDLEEWQQKAQAEEERNFRREGTASLFTGISEGDEKASVSSKEPSDHDHDDEAPRSLRSETAFISNVEAQKKKADALEELENKKLVRMGMQTAVAIALHNFPEGLATYVAVLNDPKIGAVLAVAIGIHNIPEGFCVALPIYYATGNRMKAFCWGTLSGLTEPVGAILGYLVLANSVSDASYGVMFGVVAGMMVMISLKELLPTAYRYDPGDTVVTNSLIAGMVVIAASLVLFYL